MGLFIDRCIYCGCTDNDPCFHPDHGFCGWANEEHTVCTHCADANIMFDPLTVHCINSEAEKAGITHEDIMNQVISGEPFEGTTEINWDIYPYEKPNK